MRTITAIAVHCAATPPSRDVGVREISDMHKARGFKQVDGTYCGYHWVIRRDGRVEQGRREGSIGAHVQGHNANSIGICMAGGVDATGKAEDNFTDAQWASLDQLLREVTDRYPAAEVKGHRDFSPDKDGDGVVERHEWLKDCPCFDVRSWWAERQRETVSSQGAFPKPPAPPPAAPTDVALAAEPPADVSGQAGDGARYGLATVSGPTVCFAWFTVKAEAIGYAQLRGAHVRDLVAQRAVWSPPE